MDATRQAYKIGQEHGMGAASWIVDGNTPDPEQVLGRLITGIQDGDPEVMDALPWPDLSGEWADGWTPHMLAIECGLDVDAIVEGDGEDLVDLCDEYESGFMIGVEREINRAYSALQSEAG